VLINAIHHTPAGGEISIRVLAAGGMAQVSIANSGRPIPEDALHRVFDRFVRLDSGSDGSGLGLAIARSIMRAHRGDITVTVGGQVTTFHLSLPLEGDHTAL
jgi:signal transduction histidine kinase